MPFGLWAWMGPRNRVRWGSTVQIPLGKGHFSGGPIVKYSDTLLWAVQKWLNQSTCCLGFGLGLGGPKEPCIRWGPDWPMRRCNFWGKDMSRHARQQSAVSCAQMAEALKMPFGCGLEWAQGSTCYVGVHIVATWRIRLNHPCSVAVQKNGWTYLNAVWGVDSGRPKEPCVRWGSRSPHVMSVFYFWNCEPASSRFRMTGACIRCFQLFWGIEDSIRWKWYDRI